MSKVININEYKKMNENYFSYNKAVPETNTSSRTVKKKRKKKKQSVQNHNRKRYEENRRKNNKKNKKPKIKRKRKRIRINWRLIFLILFIIILIIVGIYAYIKREDISNLYNTTKEKIEVELKPDEYWSAINDVYVSDDVLLSIPMGTYYDSKQTNRCAVKVPRNATLYAECRYKNMIDYKFKVADGTAIVGDVIDDIVKNNISIRNMRLVYNDSDTIMKYTVYSLDDGNYSTISNLNPDAVQVGNEEHPAVAYYTTNSIFDYDMYMYYAIDDETTLHISYSGPLSKILSAKELGECIYNMIDEYKEVEVNPAKRSQLPTT